MSKRSCISSCKSHLHRWRHWKRNKESLETNVLTQTHSWLQSACLAGMPAARCSFSMHTSCSIFACVLDRRKWPQTLTTSCKTSQGMLQLRICIHAQGESCATSKHSADNHLDRNAAVSAHSLRSKILHAARKQIILMIRQIGYSHVRKSSLKCHETAQVQ